MSVLWWEKESVIDRSNQFGFLLCGGSHCCCCCCCCVAASLLPEVVGLPGRQMLMEGDSFEGQANICISAELLDFVP